MDWRHTPGWLCLPTASDTCGFGYAGSNGLYSSAVATFSHGDANRHPNPHPDAITQPHADPASHLHTLRRSNIQQNSYGLTKPNTHPNPQPDTRP